MKQKLIKKLFYFLLKKLNTKFILIEVDLKENFESENHINMLSNIKERGLIRILLVRVKNKL